MFLNRSMITAAFTVMITSLVPVAPWLSVTVRRNTLAPIVVNPVIFVEAVEGLAIVAAVPLICDHAYDAMLPSGSVPLPDKVTLDVGKVIVWFAPAFATGG